MITWSIGEFDSDGDTFDDGVFLHFGTARIRAADNVDHLLDLLEKLISSEKEMREHSPFERDRLQKKGELKP